LLLSIVQLTMENTRLWNWSLAHFKSSIYRDLLLDISGSKLICNEHWRCQQQLYIKFVCFSYKGGSAYNPPHTLHLTSLQIWCWQSCYDRVRLTCDQFFNPLYGIVLCHQEACLPCNHHPHSLMRWLGCSASKFNSWKCCRYKSAFQASGN
jgi:hypothetical protein